MANTVDLGYVKGDKGDTGAKGDTGPQGPTGAKGDIGATPNLTAVAGAYIGSVGTPSVTTGGTTANPTFTFNYLKGATGAQGTKGDKGDTGANVAIKTFNGTISQITPTMIENLISATVSYTYGGHVTPFKTVALLSINTNDDEVGADNSFGYYKATSSTEGSFVKGSSSEIITVKYFG